MLLKKKNDPCSKRCKKRKITSPRYNGRNSSEFLCAVEEDAGVCLCGDDTMQGDYCECGPRSIKERKR